MKEVWKLIPGEWKFPYYVSSQGRVARLLRSGRPKILQGAVHRGMNQDRGPGYVRVRLTLDRERRECLPCYVHRLVAAAFLEKPEWGEVVHHLNHNPFDNSLGNLAWSTHRGNARYFIEFKNEQAAAGRGDGVVGPAPLLCSVPLARERPSEKVGSSPPGGRGEQTQVPPSEVLPEPLLTVSWCISLGQDSRFDSGTEHEYTIASEEGVGPREL